MQVQLERTTDETEHILKNMFTSYFYDTAPYSDDMVINEHGLPVGPPFAGPSPRTHDECVRYNWWTRDRCERYIIRADGTPAGFVIILADRAHLPPDVGYELLDFFITPKYRRQGVGQLAARAAFNLHHGSWQISELARNTPAIRFWHHVIDEYTNSQYQSLDGGARQRFQN